MVSDRFVEAFRNVIGEEGGYVNNPHDPGGETKYGIAKRSYPNVDIANLTLDQAHQIYFDNYWSKLGCDQLPKGLDEFVFDFGVNSGPTLVARKLQGAAGAVVDGIVGPATVAAVQRTGMKTVFRTLFVERALLYAAQPSLATFGHGWFARLHDTTLQFYTEVL